jgi:hypothetical protein
MPVVADVDAIFGNGSAPVGRRTSFERLPGGGYAYTMVDEPLRVEVRYLRREHGRQYAEVDVRCEWPGAQHTHGSLSCANLDLSSQTARKSLAKYCAERAHTKDSEFDWMGVIDATCLLTIQFERQGDDVIVLDDAPVVAERDIDLFGLKIPTDAASLLIAHGDSLKSMITLFVLGTMAQRGQPVLYVDWEWSADRHLARKRRLFGPSRLPGLHYRHCRAPLVIEADRLHRFCDTEGIAFIAIDSIGVACDGKLVEDDVAIRFHRALANLPPSLCGAHVPKSSFNADAKGDTQAFGSVYFSNLCRASWAVKKQPAGADPNVVAVGLFPQKQNDGERQRPVGLEFSFSPERIKVRSVDLATVDGLADSLPLAQRMAALLKREPMTLATIAEQLGAKVDSVTKAAKRADTFKKVLSADGVHRIALVERRVE